MTTLGNRIRCLFSPVAGASLRARLIHGAAMAGLGLFLLASGPARAGESEHGEAEAAPVGGDLPEAAPSASEPDPAAAISPARIVAHTAQLPKSSLKAGSRPLFPVELPSSTRLASTPSASRLPAPAPAPVNQPKLVAQKTGAAGARRRTLPLAPSASEIRREIAARNGGPLNPGSASAPLGQGEPKEKISTGARLEERATSTPVQNRRWPTHVDYTAGPGGPAGSGTAAERKGAMIEATGPQQGVIRNRW